MKSRKYYKFVSPIFMWLIVIIGIMISFNIFKKIKIIEVIFLSYIVFILTLIYWIYSLISAFAVHKKAPQSVKKINKLAKEGIYKKIRHPMYSGDIVLAFGIFLIFPDLRFFVSFLWLSLVLIIWAKLEEKALIDKFGKEYLDYKEKVPMFFPRFCVMKKHF